MRFVAFVGMYDRKLCLAEMEFENVVRATMSFKRSKLIHMSCIEGQ